MNVKTLFIVMQEQTLKHTAMMQTHMQQTQCCCSFGPGWRAGPPRCPQAPTCYWAHTQWARSQGAPGLVWPESCHSAWLKTRCVPFATLLKPPCLGQTYLLFQHHSHERNQIRPDRVSEKEHKLQTWVVNPLSPAQSHIHICPVGDYKKKDSGNKGQTIKK